MNNLENKQRELTKKEIVEKELKIYRQLSSPIVKLGYVFTYPELTKEWYPEEFIKC